MCAEAEIPQLLTKFRCILVKEAGKLNLKDFDLGLVNFVSTRRSRLEGVDGWTYKTSALEQVEAQFNYHIVFVTQNFRDLASYPPAVLQVSSEICSSGYDRLLFHNLNVDLIHVYLLVKLWRKLGLPEQLRIHARCHVDTESWLSNALFNIVETVLFGMRGSAGKAWRSPPENWGSSTEPDIAELWDYNTNRNLA